MTLIVQYSMPIPAILPVLAGQVQPKRLPADDVRYVADLGLVTTQGQVRIANRIYQEVIPRDLTYTTQLTIAHQPEWYIEPGGRLNVDKLNENLFTALLCTSASLRLCVYFRSSNCQRIVWNDAAVLHRSFCLYNHGRCYL